MFYSHESKKVSTLQLNQVITPRDLFIKSLPIFTFHNVLLRLVCDDSESCKVQGETPLETITYSKHHIVLFSSEFFLTQVSHRRFLIRQYQYKFICHIFYFLHRGFYMEVSWTYTCHIFCFSPTGVFEKVSKTYNYNYDPQIIFIVL